jgi:hypothetical protein
VLGITNPPSSTVSVPMIQLQGWADEPLSQLTFAVSNALGVVSNQTGYVIDQFYDTNQLAFTTNYFQCYDINLTNGLNTVTVHATDMAGNVTATNFNFTLDYSGATNPIIQLTWPADGMQLCQSNFTLRGWTEDSSAQVTAQIVDTNGCTNVVIGDVERTGVLWAENIPLHEGTNLLTLMVTNSAGFSSETNISLVKNDMTLSLNSIDGDLWLPTVNASGSISDTSAAVWVNGVQGINNGNGTWSATNVPISSSGVASFDMSAIPSGGGDPDASTNVDKPDEIIIMKGDEKWTTIPLEPVEDTYRA